MSVRICNFPSHPSFLLQPRSQSQTAARSTRIFARTENESSRSDQQQLNLSVLRFTFGNTSSLLQFETYFNLREILNRFFVVVGIPGLDESYLPRWIGYGFGSLILLNHFSASPPISESQLVCGKTWFNPVTF